MLSFCLVLFLLTAVAKADAKKSGPQCNDSLQANDSIRSAFLRIHRDRSLLALSANLNKKSWMSRAGMIKLKYDCELEHFSVKHSHWCKPYNLKPPVCMEILRSKIPMSQVHTALSAIKQAVSIWFLSSPAHKDKKYGPFLRMLNGWKTAVGCAVNECSKHGGYWNVICRYATRCTSKSRKLHTCFNGKRCEQHKRPRKKTKLSPFGTNNFMVNFTGGYVRILN